MSHGHWVAGLAYGLAPVLYVLGLRGGSVRGVPLTAWLLLLVLWGTALLGVSLVIRETAGDQPYHVGLAVPEVLGVLALGGFGSLAGYGVL